MSEVEVIASEIRGPRAYEPADTDACLGGSERRRRATALPRSESWDCGNVREHLA
jgi:hypothetical protein